MKSHWTERSIKDYLFSIAADFISQLEKKMKSLPLSPGEFADKQGVTKGRISQLFNNPGNIKLETIIKYARALNMKVSIVAYEDDDPNNERGPVNSDIFRICWENSGKPSDFWSLRDVENKETAGRR